MQALQWVKEGNDNYLRRDALKELAKELSGLVNPTAQVENRAVSGKGSIQQRAAMVLAYGGTVAGLSLIQNAPPQVLMAICEALSVHTFPSDVWVERIRQLELGNDILAEVKDSVSAMLAYAATRPQREFVPQKVDGSTLSGRSVFVLLHRDESKDSSREERACGIDKQGVMVETRVSYGRQVALSSVFVAGVAIIEHRVSGILVKRTLENPAAHGSPGQFGSVVACACCS